MSGIWLSLRPGAEYWFRTGTCTHWDKPASFELDPKIAAVDDTKRHQRRQDKTEQSQSVANMSWSVDIALHDGLGNWLLLH